MKGVDIVTVKQQVRSGKLEAYVANGEIYLRDVGSGECVKIGSEFDFIESGYAQKFRHAFPKCYINTNNELIVHPGRNSYFILTGIKSELELKAKVLEWLSREAIKGGTRVTMAYHLNGINEVLGTNFTVEQMETIYTYLGNAVKHDKTLKFIESGYDFEVILPVRKEDTV